MGETIDLIGKKACAIVVCLIATFSSNSCLKIVISDDIQSLNKIREI